MATARQTRNDKTSTFLRDHGYGADRLRATLARVRWTRPDGFARGQSVLQLFAATLVEILDGAAKARRRTLGTFLNDLVAANDPAERPLLWLAVRHAERESPIARFLPGPRALLERASMPLAAHWRLLAEGSVPAAQLPLIVPDRPKSVLVLMHRQLHARFGAGDERTTLQLLRTAMRLGKEQPLPLLRTVHDLLAADAVPAPVTYAAFRKLPADARRAILFTPGLAGTFLTGQARGEALPPSPDFDPLYIEQALANLAGGHLDHVDLDALVLGAHQSATLKPRIVAALANGSGTLACSDDIRERLIGASELPELCLVACAAARAPDDVHRAMARLTTFPAARVLGEALRGFALIAWQDALPAGVPALVRGDSRFVAGMQARASARLLAHVLGVETHDAAGALFRHLVAWLEFGVAPASRRALARLADAYAHGGHDILAGIDAGDLHALAACGDAGERLAMALLGACRARDRTHWEDTLFAQLADADPMRALACAHGDFRGHEIETLLHSPQTERAILDYFTLQPQRRHTRGWRDFVRRIARLETLPAALAAELRLADSRGERTLLFELLPGNKAALHFALAHVSHDLLVDAAMRDQTLGARLEKALGRPTIAALARADTVTDKPAWQAAREVALAIGLQHGPYLAFLARRLRPPFNAETRGRRCDDLYHTWRIPKRSGGERTITAPDPRLKAVQRAILDQLLATLPLHPAATGFVAGRSIVDNAGPHARQPLVVNMDVRDFFPTTRFPLIRRACLRLRERGLSARACTFIAELASHEGSLPIGAPTSPAIANLVLRSLDASLASAAARRGVAYTRYADDITFSGEQAARLLPFARRLLAQLGYAVDEKKTNLFRKGRRQIVTGLVVNERPSMARPLRRRLRAAVHHRLRGNAARWEDREISDSQLFGLLSFLAQTQPDEARALRRQLLLAPPVTGTR